MSSGANDSLAATERRFVSGSIRRDPTDARRPLLGRRRHVTKALPTFLVIGAARSGTTSVYRYLNQHPDIYMSPVKEPNFFAMESEGLDFRGPNENSLAWVTDLSDYRQLFRSSSGQKALGEASPLYLYSPKAAERIHAFIPDARLVAILRNPVERAYSAFTYLRERGSEEKASFVDALHAEDRRVREKWSHIWHYRRMGLYYEQLRRYYDRFSQDQICVVLYEDLCTEPQRILSQIYWHVEVDASFTPDTSLRHNVSGVPRVPGLGILMKPNPVAQRLREFAVQNANSLVTRVKQQTFAKPRMPAEAGWMLHDAYEDDVRRLGTLLGRNLSHWLEPYADGR
jgi:hypothetical protein